MKQILTLILILGSSLCAISQLPHWLINPTNDTLHIVEGTKLIKGKEKMKTSFWSMDGKLLYSTDQKANDFRSKLATIQKDDSGIITGFINTSGRFITLPNVENVYNHPYFENGILLAKKDDRFVMYTKDGHELSTPQMETAFPFSHGYALYFAYGQPEKQKNPFFNYVKPDGSPLPSFIIQERDKEKVIEPKDIQFLSSLDNTEKGLAIVKNKLYWLLASDYSLIPIQMGEETDKKRHLVLDSKFEHNFTNLNGDTLKIYAKYGKDKRQVFEFDKRLRLINSSSNTNQKNSTSKESQSRQKSKISEYKNGNLYGLIYNGKDSLPCQFDQVGLKLDNNAIVKSNGKWGLIQIVPDANAHLRLNSGEEIAFRHQNFPTEICVDLPASFPAEGIDIVAAPNSGITIDKASKEYKNSKSGNKVTYACVVKAPTQLSELPTEISYGPLSISYGNIKLPERHITTEGRYENHYSIEIPKSETTVNQGKVTFQIDIINEKLEGEEDFPYELILETDSLPSMTEKISDNVFTGTILNLKNGVNNVNLKVVEEGNLETIFPLQIEYSLLRKKESAIVKYIKPDDDAEQPQTEDTEEDAFDLSVDVESPGGGDA